MILTVALAALALFAMHPRSAQAYSTSDTFCGYVIQPYSLCQDSHIYVTWSRTDSYYGGAGNQTLCSGAYVDGNSSLYYQGCSGQAGEPSYNSSFACYYSNCASQYTYYMTQYVFETGPNPHTINGYGYAN